MKEIENIKINYDLVKKIKHLNGYISLKEIPIFFGVTTPIVGLTTVLPQYEEILENGLYTSFIDTISSMKYGVIIAASTTLGLLISVCIEHVNDIKINKLIKDNDDIRNKLGLNIDFTNLKDFDVNRKFKLIKTSSNKSRILIRKEMYLETKDNKKMAFQENHVLGSKKYYIKRI